MKWLYKLVLAVLFFAPIGASAQGIDLSVEIEENTAELLGENTTLALKNKVDKIITRNGMVAAEGFFALVPSIVIVDEGTVDTGMTKMLVVSADFTLSVANTMSNTIFNSQIVRLRANGRDRQSCLRAMVNQINIADVRYAKLIKDSQEIINDFYTNKVPMLIAKIEAMIVQEKFDEAMAALSMIPDNVSEGPKVEKMKIDIYNRMLCNEIKHIVAEAELLVRQGKINDALSLCRTANILSPNYSEITAFMKRLDDQAAQAEAEAREAEARKLDAEKVKEKTLQEANVAGDQIKQEIVNKLNTKSPEESLAANSSTTKKSTVNKFGKKKSLGQILFGL